jgi:hypothetical protein
MNEEFNNLDGSIDLYDAVDSITPIGNNYFDAENFYPASGIRRRRRGRRSRSGRPRPRLRRGGRGGFASRLLENQREKNRLKFAAKDKQAQAQIESARALGRGTSADAALARSLGSTMATTPQTKPGMSTTTKVLIGVGVAAVLGIGAYFLLKKKK